MNNEVKMNLKQGDWLPLPACPNRAYYSVLMRAGKVSSQTKNKGSRTQEEQTMYGKTCGGRSKAWQ
jgi:hypothetical protein